MARDSRSIAVCRLGPQHDVYRKPPESSSLNRSTDFNIHRDTPRASGFQCRPPPALPPGGQRALALTPPAPTELGLIPGETIRAQSDDYAHKLYYADSDFAIAERVAELAKRRGVKPAQIALAWLLAQRGVTAPIVGASKLTHLDDAVRAMEIRLDTGELTFLEELYQPHPVLGH